MFENASPLEWGWTVTAVAGMVPAAVLMWKSVRLEVRRRRVGIGGAVKHDIHKSIAIGAGLGVIAFCFAVAGLVAMQAPSNPTAATNQDAASAAVVIPIAFIVANVASAVTAGYCLLEREMIEREIRIAMANPNLRRRATDVPQCVEG